MLRRSKVTLCELQDLKTMTQDNTELNMLEELLQLLTQHLNINYVNFKCLTGERNLLVTLSVKGKTNGKNTDIVFKIHKK
jgi:hypothetical protein